VEYKLATKAQAAALFLRFYPVDYKDLDNQQMFNDEKEKLDEDLTADVLRALSEKFAELVPDYEFSTAELQGYLLSCFQEPEKAVEGIEAWVEQERTDKKGRREREEKKIKQQQAKKASFEAKFGKGFTV